MSVSEQTDVCIAKSFDSDAEKFCIKTSQDGSLMIETLEKFGLHAVTALKYMDTVTKEIHGILLDATGKKFDMPTSGWQGKVVVIISAEQGHSNGDMNLPSQIYFEEKFAHQKETFNLTLDNFKLVISNKIDKALADTKTELLEKDENIKTTLSEKIENVKTTLSEKIEDVKTTLSEKIEKVETTQRNEMGFLRSGLRGDMNVMESHLKKDIKDVGTNKFNNFMLFFVLFGIFMSTVSALIGIFKN